MLISFWNLWVKHVNNPWDKPTISIIRSASSHCESLSWTSLSIAETGSWESFKCTLDYVLSTGFKDDFLWSVLKDFFKSESPVFLLMVDLALELVFGDVNVDVSGCLIDLEIFWGEVYCRPGTDDYFYSIVLWHNKFSLMKLWCACFLINLKEVRLIFKVIADIWLKI